MSSSPVETALQTAEEMRRRLTERAAEDEAFRQQLLADPKSVISREFGIEIPEAINIHIHQSTKNNFHLALPVSPELDEEQLEQIAGGLCCCG